MNLVVLDGFTLNPGDLSWAGFAAHGNLDVYDFTSKDERLERIGQARHIFVNKVKVDEELLQACPQIEYIGELATGFDNIDIEACRRHGVTVTTVPGYGGAAVAQYAMGLLLELCHRTCARIRNVREGLWEKQQQFWGDWCEGMIELSGKTIGIIGLGDIGIYLAKMAKGFGMEVIAYSRTEREEGRKVAEYVSLEELYCRSDVISLHMPLNDENIGMLNAEAFAKMKDGVFIINTARGKLINEVDLIAALKSGKVGGCGLDVVASEPIDSTHPLLAFDNCLITPHLAWGAVAARQRLLDIALENYEAFLNGEVIPNRLV